jgi:hypothetical protein
MMQMNVDVTSFVAHVETLAGTSCSSSEEKRIYSDLVRTLYEQSLKLVTTTQVAKTIFSTLSMHPMFNMIRVLTRVITGDCVRDICPCRSFIAAFDLYCTYWCIHLNETHCPDHFEALFTAGFGD